MCAVRSRFSHVQLFAALWQASQVPPSMGILTSQEYWSGFPWPPPGIFLTQKSNPCLLWLLHRTRILYHWATGEVINICKTSSSLTHKISETVKGVTVNQVFRVVLSICTCQEPLLLFFKNIFYWSTAGLHCCANVVLMFSAAHWSGLVIYVYITYIYFFSYSFPLWFIPGYWIQFPVLYLRTSLLFHPMYIVCIC